MRAVTVVAPGEFEVTEVHEPTRAGANALVRVVQAGICGSDRKILNAARQALLPRILGHEMVGFVVEPDPDGIFPSGTRVLVDPAVACGTCDACRDGATNLCPHGGLMGRDFDGCFTELVTAPASRLIPIPDSVQDRSAGLLQVLGTCIHAVRQVAVMPRQTAVVVGLGVAGQLIAQLLTLRGMTVVGITRSEWKRDLAGRLGAVSTAEPDDARAEAASIADARGPQLVVDAVGTEATLALAIELAGIGADVISFGTPQHREIGLPYIEMYQREITVHNPRAAVTSDYAEAVRLAAGGALELDAIVSHVIPLDEATRAFEVMGDPTSLKVLMKVTDPGTD